MKGFLKDLWSRERPSLARAARKSAVASALSHLDRWADYADEREMAAAIQILANARLAAPNV